MPKSRSIDKFNEAKHYFDQMKNELETYERSKDNAARTRFRYAVSAFATAARSVTFVLQADYRTANSQRFETWYGGVSQKLAAIPAAATLLNIRNVSQKEGNRLPLWALESIGPTGTSLIVTYDLTSTSEDAIVGYGLKFSREDAPHLDASPSATQQELLASMIRAAPQIAPHFTEQAFQSYKPAREWLVLSEDHLEISFADFIAMCDEVLALLRSFVVEAQQLFQKPENPSAG